MLARLHGGSLEYLATTTPTATAADQAILARWSGWGDAGQLFDKPDFARQRQELQDLLTEEQYAAASRSAINAHYTDAGLAATIWNGLQRLGFTGGTVLEPGCGSGHFIGLAPPDAGMWGVEREPVSAAIARALYPDANVISGPFEEFGAAEGFFDAAIGNVPFVHAEFPDRKHNPNKHSVHNGFIIKSLRLIRPGGIVAVLTSRHTLDAINPGARREIAQLADLLGAVRLPSGAHRRAAGTDVVTDLLILRRHENDTAPAVPGETWEKALPLQIGDDTANVNQYFHQHPEHILGHLALGHGMHSDREVLVRGDLARLDTDFAAAVAGIADTAAHQGLTFAPRIENTPRPAAPAAITDPDAQPWDGTLTALPDGTFTVRVGDAELPYEPPGEEADQLRVLLGLRDVAMALISAERACIDDTPEIAALRAELNDRYDTYHAKHGPVNTFTEGRQLRTGWQVYSEWADRNGHDKAVADGALVRDYLTELMAHGLGQDHLARHLKGIVSNYETSLKRAAQRAAKSVAAKRAYGDPAVDRAAMARELADTANPLRLLAAVDEPDPRLSEEAIRSAQALIQHAPKKTDPELDLDDLGLRTTKIIRPNQGGFRDDPGSHVVASLEDFSAADQTARKTDIFRRRVIYPPAVPLGADTAEEALAICLDAHSRVDLAEIARLLGLPGEPEAREALGQLVFDDPDTGEPIWAPLYLGGNVRRKLARAETAAADDDRFAANVEALRTVIPPDLGPADVEVRLGSWIGPSYVTAFLKELLDDDHVRAERVAGLWTVHTDRSKLSAASRLAATRIWGTEKVDAYDLAQRVLTGAAIRVTAEGALDRAATEAATDKAAALSDRFAEWVWEDTARARQILRAYNDLFNSEIEVDYSGIRLSLPGMSEAFVPKDHQRIAIARIVHQGGTGLVHDVGAGKTLEIIAGVMERRRRGLARTPVVMVPNDSIADQFQRDWGQAYPGARVLMGTTDHLSGDKRKKSKNGRDARAQFIANVATRDVDAVIMTKESFESIPMPYELQKAFLQAELDDLRAEKEAHADTMSRTMTKRIEGAMENAESRLRTRISEIKRDTTGIDFVMAEFDFVVVDEAHYDKNGMVNSSIPGLSIEGSHRAIDLDMKLQYLQDRHGGPRCVLATATPWTGTVSEIYLWLRRLGHDLPRFDVWARTYVTLKKTNEMTPGGNLKPKMRPRRIINEPELWRALRVTSDIKMKEDLSLKIPAFRGGKIEVIEVPSSVEARIFTLDAARRERNISGRPEKGKDNHLGIAHDAQVAATDLRAVGITTESPQKVDYLADDIHLEWSAAKDNVYYRKDGTEHPLRGGLILVFVDESTPTVKHWNFYDELRAQLLARGLPEGSVRFIHEGKTPQRKADLLAAAREGSVAVLIGSTMKMGAGINVQDRATVGYEVTHGWRPDISAQAIGRARRQGNQNDVISWKWLVLAPSMDAKRLEIMLQKEQTFAPLYASTPPERSRDVRTDDGDSIAEAMAIATGDPRYREKDDLDREHGELAGRKSRHVGNQQSLRFEIANATTRIAEYEEQARRQDALAATLTDVSGPAFSMEILGRAYGKRTEAGARLREVLLGLPGHRDRPEKHPAIVRIAGLTLHAMVSLNHMTVTVYSPDAGRDFASVSVSLLEPPSELGLVAGIENRVKAVAAAGNATRQRIAAQRERIAMAEPEVGKPFPEQQRLDDVTRRREQLINELQIADAAETPPAEDDHSPEAVALRQRIAARHDAWFATRAKARDGAAALGVRDTRGEVFTDWYCAITQGLLPEHQPPVDAAVHVWQSIGSPGARQKPRLAPLGATRPDLDELDDLTPGGTDLAPVPDRAEDASEASEIPGTAAENSASVAARRPRPDRKPGNETADPVQADDPGRDAHPTVPASANGRRTGGTRGDRPASGSAAPPRPAAQAPPTGHAQETAPRPEKHAAATETDGAVPDTAAEIAEVTRIPLPAAQWLRRYLLAVSLRDSVRDLHRAHPDDLAQAVGRALDDGLSLRTGNHTAAARLNLPEPDPVIARRYAAEPAFAARLRETAHGWVQRRIAHDLTAGLPGLVGNLLNDLSLRRDAAAVDWLQQWISGAAADPELQVFARVNREDNAGIAIAPRLVDAAALEVMDAGDSDHPAVAYVLNEDQFVNERVLDLARHWIFDHVNRRGWHAPADPTAPQHQPDPTPAPDHEETSTEEAAMTATDTGTPEPGNEPEQTAAPLTSLRALRAIAEQSRLHVTPEHAAGEAFVLVHEIDSDGAALPPLLTCRPGDLRLRSPLGLSVTVDRLAEYLASYRKAVPSEAFQRLDTSAAARLAVVAPVVVGAADEHQDARRFVADAVGFAQQDTPTAVEFFARRLHEAEMALEGLRPATPRAARFLRAVADYGRAYSWTGDPVAHLVGTGRLPGITPRERLWIESYLGDHPDVLDGPLPDHRRIQQRDAREREERRRGGAACDERARAAYGQGLFDDALDALDDAELADPDSRVRWDHLRASVRAAASGTASAEDTAGPASSEQTPQPALLPEPELLALHARINADAADFFDEQFAESEQAQAYVRDRLGGQDKADRVRRGPGNEHGLQIGYAPPGWQNLLHHLRGKGYRDLDLIEAGVVKRNPDTGRVYDAFRDRITFAIRDDEGRVAGFTCRDRSGTAAAKYLNTATTPLFQKSRLLLGLHEQAERSATGAHDDRRAVVLHEGAFDVAATWAADTDRALVVVGVNGTALTLDHFDAIDAVVPAEVRRVFGFDPDAAAKTIASAESVLSRYPAAHPQDQLAITALPGGRDPAEWALQDLSELAEQERPPSHAAIYWSAPWTQSALGTAVLARIDRFADTLAFVDGRVAAAKHVAALLATVDPATAADHAVLVQEKLGVDVEYMAEYIAQIRRNKGGPLPTLGSDAVHPYVAARYAASRRGAEAPNTSTPAKTAEPAPSPDTTAADAPRPAPGRLARKLTVEISGRTVVLSGTDGSEPQAFRNALKDKDEVGLWFRPREGNTWKKSARTKAEAEDLARRVHEVIARFDAAETARRTPKPTFPPTPQQQAIIDAALSGRDVAVLALAGTGKTSTMRMLADRMTDRKIIYFAFNRSIADEAQGVFGRHVKAGTMHAFARQGLQNDPGLKDKLARTSKNDGYPGPVARALGIDPDGETTVGGTQVENVSLVRAALRAVKQYRESSDKQITGRHLGHGDARELTAVEAEVLRLAKVIWADKMRPEGTLQFTHDDYLKAWALTGPVLDADLIIFDETQDVNELQAHLVQSQSAQTIVVGDSYQSIYGFRGAKDFLHDWPADVVLPLTKSWRFGPAVAETGNHFLATLGADLRLEGNDALDSRIEEVRDPDAVLCRTNAGAVAAVLEGFEAGKRVALVGGGNDIKAIAAAAQNLMRNRRTNHPDLKDFVNWNAVRAYVEKHEDAVSLRTFVGLVDRHRPEGLIALADELADEHATAVDLRPELVVSTAHKAKGREWSTVQIADDFRQPDRHPDTGEIILPSGEDLRLAYVTVTRAKQRLGLGSLAWIREYAQSRHPDAAAPADLATAEVAAEAADKADAPAAAVEAPALPASLDDGPALASGDDGLTVLPDAARDTVREVLESEGWEVESLGEPVEAGEGELWSRGDWSAALTFSHDGLLATPFFLRKEVAALDKDANPVVTNTAWERGETAVSSLDEVRQVLAEAGRHGWVVPSTRPGMWRLTTEPTAAHARAAAAAVDRREVIRADDGTWRSAAGGDPIAVLPLTPVLQLADLRAVTRFVLGAHYGDADVARLVPAVLAGEERNGVTPEQARRRLAETAPDVHRRAAAAALGAGVHHGRAHNADGATVALQRLLDGDPTLRLPAPAQPELAPAPRDAEQPPLPAQTAASDPDSGPDPAPAEDPLARFLQALDPAAAGTATGLRTWLRERTKQLPESADGVSTGPVRLALALAGAALVSGDAFTAGDLAARVAGRAAEPGETARRLRQLVGRIADAAPADPRDAFGLFPDGRDLVEHLRAVADSIDTVLGDRNALRRAQADALFAEANPDAIRVGAHFAERGELEKVHEFLGGPLPPQQRTDLIDDGALWLLQEAFVHQSARTRFDVVDATRRLLDDERGEETALTAQALAHAARARARVGDDTGRALRDTGFATIAHHLDTVAAHLAREHGFALPGEPGTRHQPIETSPTVLTDVASALRAVARLEHGQFAHLVREVDLDDPRAPADPDGSSLFGYERGPGEADPGAVDTVEFHSRGLNLTVDLDHGLLREGRLSWPQVQSWVRSGLTPGKHATVLAADTAVRGFDQAADAFDRAGEASLARTARDELAALREATGVAVVDAAQEKQSTGRARIRRPKGTTAKTEADLLTPEALSTMSRADRETVQRILALAAVLPPAGSDTPAGSLRTLVPHPGQAPEAAEQAAETARAESPDAQRIGVAVPEGVDPADAGWERIATTYGTPSTETWARGSTQLVLTWLADGDDATLAPRLVMRDDLLPAAIEHDVSSVDDLRTVLREAGRVGFALPDGPGWAVFPQPTAVRRGAPHRRSGKAQDVRLDPQRGWVRANDGAPLGTPAERRVSGPSASATAAAPAPRTVEPAAKPGPSAAPGSEGLFALPSSDAPGEPPESRRGAEPASPGRAPALRPPAALPGGLDAEDVTAALGGLNDYALVKLVDAADEHATESPLSSPHGWNWFSGRDGSAGSADNRPDGLRISCGADSGREGTLPWPLILGWVRDATTPQLRQAMRAALAAEELYGVALREKTFAAAGEETLARLARRELHAFSADARTALLSGLADVLAGNAAKPADPLRSDVLSRVAALAAVLPAASDAQTVPADRLAPGDVIAHPNHPDTPFRILETSAAGDDSFVLTGELVRFRGVPGVKPGTATVSDWDGDRAECQLWPLPASLATLVTPPAPLAPPADAPDTLDVPPDTHPSRFGWTLTGVSYEADDAVQSWTRNTATLLLRWMPGEPGPRLSTRLRLLAAPLPDPVEHTVASLDQLRAVLAEAGLAGTARQTEGGWAVSPTVSREVAANAADRDESVWQVGWERVRGWGFVTEGGAVPVPEEQLTAPRPAAPPPGQEPSPETHASLWDAPADGGDAVPSPILATGLIDALDRRAAQPPDRLAARADSPGDTAEHSSAALFARGISVAARALADAGAAGGSDPDVWVGLLDLTGSEPQPEGAPAHGSARPARWWVEQAVSVLWEEFSCTVRSPAVPPPDGPRVAVAAGRILLDADEPLPAQAALLLAEIARLRWEAERADARSGTGQALPPVEITDEEIDRSADRALPDETLRNRSRAASPRQRDELRALGRAAAALGYRLGSADRADVPHLPFSGHGLTYDDLIAEATRMVDGARLATSASVTDHPAVGHVRAALARRWLPEDARRREWTKAMLAMEAVADYVPTPQRLSLVALAEDLADARTPGHGLSPRWLDALPADQRDAAAEAIDQAARVIDAAAETDLPWLTAQLRAVGRELRRRPEAPTDTPPWPGIGAAGVVLLPAAHPAAAPLETQLRDALRFQPWIHGSAEHAGRGVTALLALIESPPADASSGAQSVLESLPEHERSDDVVKGLAAQLVDAAFLLRAAGHTRPVGDRSVPLPDIVHEVAARLADAANAGLGRRGDGTEGFPRHQPTMMAPVARVVQRGERRRQLETAAAARLPQVVADARADAETTLRNLGDDARGAARIAQAADALGTGDTATAQAHLADVLTTTARPRALGGHAAVGVLRLELQRAALGGRAPEPDWVARSIPTGLLPGGASDLAANCAAWAEALRAGTEAGDDLGELLARSGIRDLADALDEQARLLAARHATASFRPVFRQEMRTAVADSGLRRDRVEAPPSRNEPAPAPAPVPVSEPDRAAAAAHEGEPGLFDVVPANPAHTAGSAADQPWALAPAGASPVFPADEAEDPGPYGETFAQVLSVAMTAVVETATRGGHDPDSWLGFSDLVMRHPDGATRRTGRDGTLRDGGSLWWLRQAARVLRDDHGIELEVRLPARGSRHRPEAIALDRDRGLLVLDGGQPDGTLAFNAMATLAELRIEAERDAELHRTTAAREPVEVSDEEIDTWLRLARPPANPEEGGVFTASELYARAHALAREAAGLGMRLNAPADAPPVRALEVADGAYRTDRQDGVPWALPLSARGLPQRLAEARTRIDGLTIATTADLSRHPAVARVRTAVADAKPGSKATPEERARLRGMAAAMALQDFLPLPLGYELVSVVEETTLLRGTPEELLPRRLDHVPELVLPHLADVLRQAGRCLDTADESLGWLAARLRAMAGVLEQRAARDHGGLPVLPHSRTGLAALTLAPPDHPASPTLETQLMRYRDQPVSSFNLTDSYAMKDILATLADPAETPARQADRLAVDDPAQPKRHVMSDERRFDIGRAFVQIAHAARTAGHRRPVGTPALPLPDYLNDVGHALMRRSGLTSTAPLTAAPIGDWSEDTVAQRLQRRAENAAAERKRAVKETRATALRARQEATAILHAMTAPEGTVARRAEQAMAASEADDPVSARLHLAEAIAAADRVHSLSKGAGFTQGLVVHWLQRDVLGDRAMTPAWVARASATTGHPGDSAETKARYLTTNLSAWAWALREASNDTDRLGRMLQAIGIDRVAADLDAVSAALAERHAFRAPEPPQPKPLRSVGPVVLSDGRELARVADDSQLPHRFRDRWPGDAFMLTVPGRARVIVAAPSPEVSDAAPWWWAVQQLDASGDPVGAEQISGTAYRNPAAALQQAEKAFGQLLAALDKPVHAATAGVQGPMADLAFVPRWGGFAEQLNHQNLPATLRHRTAQLALGMIPRLDARSTTPESNASWLLAGGDGPPLTREQQAEATGYLRDLAALADLHGKHGVPRRLVTGGPKPRAVSTALKEVLAHAEAALTQPESASPAPVPSRGRSIEGAPADRDIRPGQAAAETTSADAAQAPPVAALPMADGRRALRHRWVEAGEKIINRFGYDTYELTVPGRFSLVVKGSPAEVPPQSGKPWTWFLHRIDADGKPRGAGLRETRYSQKTHEYRTPQAALAEAEKWLAHLERHLDEPQLVEPSPVRGPIGELEFVPGWGDVSSQLKDQTLHGLPPAAEWAVRVAWRLNTAKPSPEREAAWIRETGHLTGNVKFAPDFVDEIAGHIGDLADHIAAASGVPDLLPEAQEPTRLTDVLRMTRDTLRPAAPQPTSDADARQTRTAAAPGPETARALTTPAETAPPVEGPDTATPPAALTLSDGRQATRDDAPGDSHELAAYRLDVPGFRLRIKHSRDETGTEDWRWSLRRVDDTGRPSGAALKDSAPLTTAAAAITEAEPAVAALEAFLRTPPARRRETGPFAALEFVPGWGTAADQIRRLDLPPEAATGLPRIAVMIAERLDAPDTSHLNAARWAAHGPGRQRRDDAQLTELIAHIRDLESRIAASGVDDRLTHQPDGPGLRATLRATRNELAFHISVDPDTLRPSASSATPSQAAEHRPDKQPRRAPAARPRTAAPPPQPEPVAPPAPAAAATAPEAHSARPEPESVADPPAAQPSPVSERREDPALGTPDDEQVPAPWSDPAAGRDGYDWADQLEEEHGDFDPFVLETADEPVSARDLATDEPRENRSRAGNSGTGQPDEPAPPVPDEPAPQPAPPAPAHAPETVETAVAEGSGAPETVADDTEPAPEPQQIGVIQVLRRRIYLVDPDADTFDPGTELAVVEPGRYPLFRQGDETFWTMSGIRLGGDGGLDLTAPDRVSCSSRRYTATGWQQFLSADPICQEGRDGQRLRVVLAPDDPAAEPPSQEPAVGPADASAAERPDRADDEARRWGDLVAGAAELGVSVRSVFSDESETRWSPGDPGPQAPDEATVLVSAAQPPGERNADLATRLVDVAMTGMATDTTADIAIPGQRTDDLAAERNTGPRHAADRPVPESAWSGRLTRLNLADMFRDPGTVAEPAAPTPAMATARAGGKHARPGAEDTTGETTPIYDQLLRAMAHSGLADPSRVSPAAPRNGDRRRPHPAGGRTPSTAPDFATAGRTR